MRDAIGIQEITATGTNPTSAHHVHCRQVPLRTVEFVSFPRLALAIGALAALTWSGQVTAAGSRAAVEAKPGEIVVLRAVPTRPAAREMPPGRALLVDASPKSELEQGLSHLEISSSGYGQVAAGTGGSGLSLGGSGGSIAAITHQLSGSGAARGDGAPSAAGGAIGAATGSIGSTVTGALSGAGLIGKGGSR